MFLLGFAIFLFGGIFMAAQVGGVRNLLDLYSLAAILVPLAAVLTATRSFKVLYGGLRAAIFTKEPLDDNLRGQAASLFRMLSKTTALASVIGFLLNVFLILTNMDANGSETLRIFGWNLGVAIRIPLYGLFFIAAVFEPIVFILKKRQSERR